MKTYRKRRCKWCGKEFRVLEDYYNQGRVQVCKECKEKAREVLKKIKDYL